MRNLSVMAFLFFISYCLKAQDEITLLYSDHFQLNASRIMPSLLGYDQSKMQLSIGYFNVWLGNNRVSFGSMRDQQNTTQILNEVEHSLKKTNRMGTGQDLQSVAFSIKAMKDKKEKVTVGFGITDQLSMSLTISDNLFKIIWNGNKQFAGQKVDLGPLRFNALYNRQYFMAMAIPFGRSEKISGRLGFRIKYIEGISSVYMPHEANGTLFTEKDGKYIQIDAKFESFTSGVSKDFSAFVFNGHGFGFHLGTSFIWTLNKVKLQAAASVLDIGAIYFKHNTRQVVSNNVIDYGGQVIDGFFGGRFDFGTDSLTKILNADVNKDVSYKSPLSTRVVLNLEMKTPGFLFKKSRATEDANAFFITYIQGIRNYTKSTTTPYVALGYRFGLFDVWNIGASIGYGGFNKLTVGAFTSIGVKYFRVGIGSTNLAGIIYRKRGTGIDLSFSLMFGF